MKIKHYLFFSLLLLLSACAGLESEDQLGEPFSIAISPSAAPITPAVNLCANDSWPSATQYRIDQVFPSQFSNAAYDLVIQISEPNSDFPFSVQIASESFFLITHLSTSPQSIKTNTIKKLFSGEYSSWADIAGQEIPIELWIPSSSDENRQFLENHILDGQTLYSNARLSISPEQMRSIVAENVAAIGILPGAWLDSSVNAVSISEALPILASSDKEAQGALHEMLACLQNGAGQNLIREIYQP